jgi:hypothetical protein
MIGLIVVDSILMVTLLNTFFQWNTYRSLEKDIKKLKWDKLTKEQYARKSFDFVAERFKKVNRCWLKFPWRNMFFNNMWKMKGKGLPCHMQNFFYQKLLLKRFNKEEIKTIITQSWEKGMAIHFYSKIKLKEKWVDVDVWAKKWGVPFGKNVHNTKLV